MSRIFVRTYMANGYPASEWIPTLLENADEDRRAAELLAMPGTIGVDSWPIDHPCVPSTVREAALRRARSPQLYLLVRP